MKNNLSLPPFWVIVPAAGIGRRMRADIPKQYLSLGCSTVIEQTLACFLAHPRLLGIVVCLAKDDPYWPTLSISQHPLIETVIGGRERADSVLAGLNILSNKVETNDWVLVHDAARPNLQREDLDKLLISAGQDAVGGLLATPARDTLKEIDSDGRVKKTLDRKVVWQALTPQMFRLHQLQQKINEALALGKIITDEASAMEFAGLAPLLVEGRSDNLKITHPEDIQRLNPYFLS